MANYMIWMFTLLSCLKALSCFGSSPNQTYYITPTSMDPCPMMPCLTLEQFARSQSKITNINMTLIIWPGKHSLGSKLSIANIDKFVMSTKCDDSTTEITCDQFGRFNFTNVHTVHISCFNFFGCTGNWIESVDMFFIRDSNFLANEGTSTSGGAMEIYLTSIVISKTSFKFYRGSVQQLYPNRCPCKGGSTSKEVRVSSNRIGGAIVSVDSNITIIDGKFEKNSANIGGAIYSECSSNVVIINSMFTNNYVHNDIDFNKIAGGGVLYSGNSGKVTINNCQFYENGAYRASGGVLMAAPDSIISITASQFNSNIAGRNGGVVYALRNSTGNVMKLTVINSQFKYNNALQGGVLFTTAAVRVNVTESKFARNYALNNAGVMFLNQYSKLSIKGCSFDDNKAANTAAAIYVGEGAQAEIFSSSFSNNTSSYGAIVHSNKAFVLISNRSTFYHNIAFVNGGVIQNYQGTLEILNECEFSHNKASNDGGVIHNYHGTLTMSRSNILYDNMAGNDGGVIYASESILKVTEENIFSANTAHDGGAIHAYKCSLNISYRNSFNNNTANQSGGAIHAYQSNLGITDENLISYNSALNDGGAIYTYQATLKIYDSKFLHNNAGNDGGVIKAYETNTVSSESHYGHNSAGNRGGAWNVYKGRHEVLQNSLSQNIATDGGALYVDMGDITVENSSYLANTASKGGALYTYQSYVCMLSINVSCNSAQNHGGGWFMREGSVSVVNSILKQNSAGDEGGALHTEDGRVIFQSVIITANSANTGGAMYADSSVLNASKSLLITENTAYKMGTVFLLHGLFLFDGNIEFSRNNGSLAIFSSTATFVGTTKMINSSEPLRSRDKLDIQDHEGGALTLFRSSIHLAKSGILHAVHNSAADGGAIRAIESKMHMYGKALFASNIASNHGGGIFVYQSELNSRGNSSLTLLSNRAEEKGGGIHAINSTLNVEAHFNHTDGYSVVTYLGSRLYFIENKAVIGGGLYLDVYSKLYVSVSKAYSGPQEIVNFIRNSARYGAAVYESSSSDSGIYHSPKFNIDPKAKECSIQTVAIDTFWFNNLTCENHDILTLKSIFFHENSAVISGSSFYSESKAPLCNITQCTLPESVNGISYFKQISNIVTNDIGTRPAKLCFCKDSKQHCDTHVPIIIKVEKGTKITVEFVAMDEVGHPVNAEIRGFLYQAERFVGEGWILNRTCTKVSFDIPYITDHEIVKMHVTHSNVKRSVNIEFISCDHCPIGFQNIFERNNACKCGCDPKLKPYITSCNASAEVLTREGEFWITYINSSNEVTSGYLIYPFCPYNYCLPPTPTIEINLNIPNGADSQCADGHSGLLCSRCRSGLSLSLGSSRCIPCSTKWPVMLLVISIAAILAGVILVVLLLVINLTVAVGSLNSIIFYANIVDANSSIFLPFSKPNIATVFMASLNLEIGFDTCFYEGMDAFWKTLLELMFPLYVIFLVVLIIHASERSTRFAKLLARKNPVAALATLIFLSYSKQLQTVIDSLSFATLEYPDGSHKRVWLPDASVEYLKGKHIVLFTIAVLILLAGAAYTALLFAWQWLLCHQDKVLLKWMRYQKLCHFVDPYHAPYNFGQRYWFGLLLIARIPIYIISAVVRDPRFKLLSSNAVVIFLILVKTFSFKSQMYKKRLLDVLDTIMYTNAVIFATLTWYTFDIQTYTRQQVRVGVAYSSVCVTFTLLVCVICYHTFRYTSLFSSIQKAKTSMIKLFTFKRNAAARNHPSSVLYETSESTPLVTYSTVELSECTV